ncbi:hypothetical protein [Carnobacterium sp. PL17GRE32]|uniref:hypothetical protein n=1 Tax=Carnobacterium sp. PL17GRE32 TaxID=2592355 RepID=UPI0011EC7731|nr:hypothetical protein [Carnobacterium sp. PL17GRE32]KAF3306181.1 hypothetical protein FPV25_02285 [Carnobacterium sp. PL17GRE32]
MEENNTVIGNVLARVDEFKDENAVILRDNIQNEISSYKSSLPSDNFLSDIDYQINQEIDNKISEFKQDIDLKPKALYYNLKSKVELSDDITEKELTLSAYEFLEKNTKNRFLKKILKDLKKEAKK